MLEEEIPSRLALFFGVSAFPKALLSTRAGIDARKTQDPSSEFHI